MKRLLASVAATVLSLTPVLAQDCTPTVTTVDPGKLTVAVYDYPPFNIVAADGSVSGIDPSRSPPRSPPRTAWKWSRW
jgi:polar amino acid transport system substrate-binding protein